MKKVSIIMPVYNGAKFIADAINSVLSQTYKNVELLIVDDESTDKTLSIAKEFEGDKVKVYSQKHAGACRARNFAFERSTGDYIQYLDADDILSKDKLEKQIYLLEQNGDNSIVFCSYTSNFEDYCKGVWQKQEIDRAYSNPIDLYLDIFNGKGSIMGISWLFPRELIIQSDKWNETLIKAQDWDFVIKIALKCPEVLYCNDTFVYCRITGQNITSNQSPEAINSVLVATESVRKTIQSYEDSDRVRKALISLYSSIFCSYYDKTTEDQLQIVERNIDNLGGKLAFKGNKLFGYLSGIIGVKNALLLKSNMKKKLL
jgi:glycosyltransferase involved in cell wall biosynthesis